MTRIFIALLCMCAALAYAGQSEFDRDAAKVKAEHSFAVKNKCGLMKDAKAKKQCVSDEQKLLNDVLANLKRQHGVK